MFELLLAVSDAGTAWRNALALGDARAGWECVGPLGFAKRLGRLYGLRGEPTPHAQRVSAYAARLEQLDDSRRSFSRPRKKNPWGVAVFLLGLRDRLRAAEWNGGPIDGSPRLADLAAAEQLSAPGLLSIPPGISDFFFGLLGEIEREMAVPEPLVIRVTAPDIAFDPILRRVLAALSAKGAVVTGVDEEIPGAPATIYLSRLQQALLSFGGGKPGPALAGDGSVLVVEADTPLEAAELAAAYTRSANVEAATLIAGCDPGALGAAFARHALPAICAGERSRWRPALQVLPLRLALGFAPRDPFRAAELLMLLDERIEEAPPGAPRERRYREQAAPLVARGAEVERHRAREVVADAARSLVALLQAGGWSPRAVEGADQQARPRHHAAAAPRLGGPRRWQVLPAMLRNATSGGPDTLTMLTIRPEYTRVSQHTRRL